MALNPLAPVTDYQSLLNRIFWFTSIATLAAISLLHANLPTMQITMAKFDHALGIGLGESLPIRASFLLPALGVGLLARVFRLHAHLSNWLGISERFDVDVILPEFAHQLGIRTEHISESEWLQQRRNVMQQAFYRFASSNNPQIDAHLIHQALDLWSWFWIGVQATVVFILSSLALIACQCYEVGAILLATTVCFAAIGLPAIRSSCRRYAIAQVKAIIADTTRETLVREAFQWVETPSLQLRRSA